MRSQSNPTSQFAFGSVVDMVAGQTENRCHPVTCQDYVDLRVPSATCYLPVLCSPFLADMLSVRFSAGSVETETFYIFIDQMLLSQRSEQSVKHAIVSGASLFSAVCDGAGLFIFVAPL